MNFHYYDLETCDKATGLVIVIDVIRAFTNAAFAFSRGAKEIHPVSTVDEALLFKSQNPNSLACGEVGGLPPEGFDFGNSPTQTNTLELDGRVVIQRTGAGTQGIVHSVNAEKMFAASFVVARATVKYVQGLAPSAITFVITGKTHSRGEEDLACAEYLEALFKGNSPDPAPFLERVRSSEDAREFLDPDMPQFPESDLAYCMSLDKFNFVMPIFRENGRHVMRAVPQPET